MVLVTKLLNTYLVDLTFSEKEFLVFPHVLVVRVTRCWNCCDLVSHIFGKNFVKVNNVFTKVIAIELI